MTTPRSIPPAPVLREMGAYEECLAEAQRLYRRLKDARAAEREAAARAYDEALQRAREAGARVARGLNA